MAEVEEGVVPYEDDEYKGSVEVLTWGTHRGNGNGILHHADYELFGGDNMGHAAIRMKLPINPETTAMIEEFCVDNSRATADKIVIPYKKVKKSVRAAVVNPDGGYTMADHAAYEEEYYEVYFSWWPGEERGRYLEADHAEDRMDERDGVHYDEPEAVVDALGLQHRMARGRLGSRKIVLGPQFIIHKANLDHNRYDFMKASTQTKVLEAEIESFEVLFEKLDTHFHINDDEKQQLLSAISILDEFNFDPFGDDIDLHEGEPSIFSRLDSALSPFIPDWLDEISDEEDVSLSDVNDLKDKIRKYIHENSLPEPDKQAEITSILQDISDLESDGNIDLEHGDPSLYTKLNAALKETHPRWEEDVDDINSVTKKELNIIKDNLKELTKRPKSKNKKIGQTEQILLNRFIGKDKWKSITKNPSSITREECKILREETVAKYKEYQQRIKENKKLKSQIFESIKLVAQSISYASSKYLSLTEELIYLNKILNSLKSKEVDSIVLFHLRRLVPKYKEMSSSQIQIALNRLITAKEEEISEAKNGLDITDILTRESRELEIRKGFLKSRRSIIDAAIARDKLDSRTLLKIGLVDSYQRVLRAQERTVTEHIKAINLENDALDELTAGITEIIDTLEDTNMVKVSGANEHLLDRLLSSDEYNWRNKLNAEGEISVADLKELKRSAKNKQDSLKSSIKAIKRKLDSSIKTHQEKVKLHIKKMQQRAKTILAEEVKDNNILEQLEILKTNLALEPDQNSLIIDDKIRGMIRELLPDVKLKKRRGKYIIPETIKKSHIDIILSEIQAEKTNITSRIATRASKIDKKVYSLIKAKKEKSRADDLEMLNTQILTSIDKNLANISIAGGNENVLLLRITKRAGKNRHKKRIDNPETIDLVKNLNMLLGNSWKYLCKRPDIMITETELENISILVEQKKQESLDRYKVAKNNYFSALREARIEIEKEVSSISQRLKSINTQKDKIGAQYNVQQNISKGKAPDNIEILPIAAPKLGIAGMSPRAMLQEMRRLYDSDKGFDLNTKNCSVTTRSILAAGSPPGLKSYFEQYALGAIVNPQTVHAGAFNVRMLLSKGQTEKPWYDSVAHSKYNPAYWVSRGAGALLYNLIDDTASPTIKRNSMIGLVLLSPFILIRQIVNTIINPIDNIKTSAEIIKRLSQKPNNAKIVLFKAIAYITLAINMVVALPTAIFATIVVKPVKALFNLITSPFKLNASKKRASKLATIDSKELSSEYKFIRDKKSQKVSSSISANMVEINAKTPAEGIKKMREIIRKDPNAIPVFSPRLQRKVNKYISKANDETQHEVKKLTEEILQRANNLSFHIGKTSLYGVDFPKDQDDMEPAIDAALAKIKDNTFSNNAKLTAIIEDRFEIDNSLHIDFVAKIYSKLKDQGFTIEVTDKFKRQLLEEKEEHPEIQEKYENLIDLIETTSREEKPSIRAHASPHL